MSTRATTPAGRRRVASRRGAAGRAQTAPAKPAAPRKTPRRSPPSRPKRPSPPGQRAASRSGRAPRRRASARARRLRWHRGVDLRSRPALLPLIALALVAGYLGWFRDSSLVAVTSVKVEGVTTPDREQITAALTDAAEGMTTLHVRDDELAAVAARFPSVAALSTDASFPHGLTIRATERKPVLVARSGDRAVPVAADGTLLTGMPSSDLKLATLNVAALPESGRLGGDALEEALVIGAAPDPLLPLIELAAIGPDDGVIVTLDGGFQLRFGTSSRAAAKWAAAAAVLADPKLSTLSYVDVRTPERPAVGGAGTPADVATTVPPPPAATNPAAPAAQTTTPATTATTDTAP